MQDGQRINDRADMTRHDKLQQGLEGLTFNRVTMVYPQCVEPFFNPFLMQMLQVQRAHRLIVKIPQGDALALGQRMIARNRTKTIRRQQARVVLRGVVVGRRGICKPEIYGLPGGEVFDLAGTAGEDGNADVGFIVGSFCNEFREQVSHRAGHGGNAQGACLAILHAAHGARHAGQIIKDRGGFGQKVLGFWHRNQFSPSPFEQLHTQAFLKRFDGSADGGLGPAKFYGCFGQGSRGHNGVEGGDLDEVHV